MILRFMHHYFVGENKFKYTQYFEDPSFVQMENLLFVVGELFFQPSPIASGKLIPIAHSNYAIALSI